MLGILRTIFRTGCKPEQLAESNQLEASDQRLEAAIRKRFNGSLAIRQVDAGSCNGCELEIHASNNCYYDLERFGCHFVASPRHADMLLVTGPVTRNMATALQMTFDAMPAPKLVVAVGDCAANCGVFGKDNYAIAGTVSDIIPVDITVHGCPPTPTDIIRGILKAIEP
ncbi:MAG: hydrogenase [Zetaproteobacteria bacterium CG12_big_fil_rev_8_21_14_0_65_55_1124]|nr:MAG: hydrogenase [Zetaproteobacteria bacterium CG1_02_55_237]PIS20083.1 MAG: hydrogenase [Zetaproteobacteria bacterium CG08_land_8_20_14_0_20_55_17]PIW43215.1 MAG: hydrogenase [Zetaproteobacteria bacterium CG12_big_fil_rev_8_21_14_0_65_55_1124]PIY53161.1 MAG: hydrogenase [Zetaproteobacteria bacterium CG_4_10_14_0_8_um_filter_55_43]PIZ39672.1 MAG: hydrogenase [Zetaproteobacteria bacterium CG_4_10_14_0_2_um_filter_55_20]PJB79375.1 MAG: hydrogenase [Zetaproteobacteria bacterium CG_4_9_14_0_8_u